MPSSLESLYNQIKGTGVAGKSYGEFQEKMADSAYRQGLYKSLTKHGAKVGANLGEFEEKLGYGYVSPSARPEPIATPQAQPQQPQMKGTEQKGNTPLTEQDKLPQLAKLMGVRVQEIKDTDIALDLFHDWLFPMEEKNASC